ncbi:MAG: hypothetical protein ACRDZM_03290, partial [Acidimicrobiia bacterium]
VGLVFVALIVLAVIAIALRRQRKRAASIDLEDKSWLRANPLELEPSVRTAPVRDFHVHGTEARVYFDVPMPDEDDPILNELLVDEAVEVVREKRHNLPIGDVTEIVVFAGRGEDRQVGRSKLPAPGVLPPPIESDVFNLTHIARDPFATQFDVDHTLRIDTAVQVPADELSPLRDELKVPIGLDRGLRARGLDPDTMTGPEFILSLLEMFGYTVKRQDEPGLYMASKANVSTFIRAVSHVPGEHPELDVSVIRKFVAEFATSGADRGMLVSDKYGPFMTHDIEDTDRRIRFITRERAQAFVDSMSLH